MRGERQEGNHREALVHPPLCGAKRIVRALVIGGGDGRTAHVKMRQGSDPNRQR
jgi:spermidine synthase